ncbi:MULTISPECIES: beta-phosphoglucomutase family hydrolase [unclassified Agarivorans]|uniref:beta-phosphoglucomutase family hydrolase n=1 Tax=unclassified Agarivorans TaxID=2636026 RepID=UPI0026E1BAB9|nr:MULTISPECIES: beta-phosphoglucomutase family hydrolase [unclassified Agarivorans]MDO6687682.1 beta-phosphoglucomutase family hydrolase [Agarivorans sp. 3_MG-2023]MDO6717236.1 beta-phosphoglucomutase family hydrolase [Agarivorans sp. 2_MG-2023]
MNIQQYQDYEAFIFDMDGTLIDSMKQHQQAWEFALQQFNIPYTSEQMLAMSGMPTGLSVEKLLADAHISNIDIAAVAEAKEQRYHQLMNSEVLATPLIEVFEYYLGKKPMAVGTGASQQQAELILANLGIAKQFEAIVGADLVAEHKPAPDTFLKCAELMNVQPQGCLVFEDADAGVAAANAAGMDVVDVRNLWPANYFVD